MIAMNTDTILVVEDDAAIRRVVVLALKTAGYAHVLEADSGTTGLACAMHERPRLVLLDVLLPSLDGLEVCRRLRAHPDTAHTPVIMLTAKSEEQDVVSGLDAGATDYVTKPFSKNILLARVRAALRRPDEKRPSPHLSLGGLDIDNDAHTVTLNGVPLSLTLSEYRILELLVANHNRVFTRAHIIDRISDEQKVVTDRTVDVQMVNLRRKLGAWAQHVETIRGVGYRIC